MAKRKSEANDFFTVEVVPLDAFKAAPATPKSNPRDDALIAAMNQAATIPSSEAVTLKLAEGQKMPTIRAAINRLLAAEPRAINWGVRGDTIVFSKGEIPGGRGRKRKAV